MGEFENTKKDFNITKEQNEKIEKVLNEIRRKILKNEEVTYVDLEKSVSNILTHLDKVTARYATEEYLKYVAKEKDRYGDVYVALYSGFMGHDQFIKDNNIR